MPFGIYKDIRSIFWQFSVFYGHLVYLRSFGVFYCHLVYFTVIWCTLWSFGVFYGHLVYISPILYFLPRKSGKPFSRPLLTQTGQGRAAFN
jgi:hypothetical protein